MVDSGVRGLQGVLYEGNEHTVRMTKAHISLFKIWLAERNDHREPETIPPHELNSQLANFLSTVRKQNDLQYEPQTLSAIYSSICRYLRLKNYLADIKQDEVFHHSRNVLSSKIKELKLLGKGKYPYASISLTDEEIRILIQKNLLGTKNPKALVNSLWLTATMHFELYTGKQHRGFLWGDISSHVDDFGQEYLKLKDRRSKSGFVKCAPLIFATGSYLCPVAVYKEFAIRRDPQSFSPNSPFYVQPLKTQKHDSIWFSCSPLGKNSIASIAKNMALDGGLTGKRITNRSVHKMNRQTLLLADIPPTVAEQVTWYINVQPLENYSAGDNVQRTDTRDVVVAGCDGDDVRPRNPVIAVDDEPVNVSEDGQETVKLELAEDDSMSSKQTADSDESDDDDEQTDECDMSLNDERDKFERGLARQCGILQSETLQVSMYPGTGDQLPEKEESSEESSNDAFEKRRAAVGSNSCISNAQPSSPLMVPTADSEAGVPSVNDQSTSQRPFRSCRKRIRRFYDDVEKIKDVEASSSPVVSPFGQNGNKVQKRVKMAQPIRKLLRTKLSADGRTSECEIAGQSKVKATSRTFQKRQDMEPDANMALGDGRPTHVRHSRVELATVENQELAEIVDAQNGGQSQTGSKRGPERIASSTDEVSFSRSQSRSLDESSGENRQPVKCSSSCGRLSDKLRATPANECEPVMNASRSKQAETDCGNLDSLLMRVGRACAREDFSTQGTLCNQIEVDSGCHTEGDICLRDDNCDLTIGDVGNSRAGGDLGGTSVSLPPEIDELENTLRFTRQQLEEQRQEKMIGLVEELLSAVDRCSTEKSQLQTTVGCLTAENDQLRLQIARLQYEKVQGLCSQEKLLQASHDQIVHLSMKISALETELRHVRRPTGSTAHLVGDSATMMLQ